jgi:hypothetical protein
MAVILTCTRFPNLAVCPTTIEPGLKLVSSPISQDPEISRMLPIPNDTPLPILYPFILYHSFFRGEGRIPTVRIFPMGSRDWLSFIVHPPGE